MALAMLQAKTPISANPVLSILPQKTPLSSAKTTARTRTAPKPARASHAPPQSDKKSLKVKHEPSTDSPKDDSMDMSSPSDSNSPFDTPSELANGQDISSPATANSPPTCLPDSTGQITKTWDVPPRPKPGRKPAIDVPPTKRKAQNRDSQRKFRQKKVEEVQELRNQLRSNEEEIQKKEAQWTTERQSLQQEVQQMRQWHGHAQYWQQIADANQAAVTNLEAKVRELEKDLVAARSQRDIRPPLPSPLPSLVRSNSSWGTDSGISGIRASSNSLQPSNTGLLRQYADDEMEMDFTTYPQPSTRAGRDFHEHRTHDEVPSMAIDHPMEGTCGFCDQGGLCLCKEVAQQPNTLPAMGNDAEADIITRRGQAMEPPTKATGPGTCDACLADPDRRRLCQSLANQMRLPPISEISGHRASISTVQPSAASRITCAETFDKLNQYPSFKENSSRIIQELRPEPIGEPSRREYAPLAVDKESLDAACMLAAMSSEPPVVHPSGIEDDNRR